MIGGTHVPASDGWTPANGSTVMQSAFIRSIVMRTIMRRGIAKRAAVLAVLLAALPALAPRVAHAQGASAPRATPTGITGVVVDSAGKPIRDARVVLREPAQGNALGRRWESMSDPAGRFRIEQLPPGTLRLEITREAYEPAGFDVKIAAGVTVEVRLRLVVDEQWVLVKQVADSLARADSIAAEAVRNRGGGVDNGGSGGVTITNGPPAVLPSTDVGTNPRASRATRNLLSGRVLTPSGEPLGRVQIQAMGTTLFTLTDSTGRFWFRDLAQGPYFLRVRKVGFEPVVFTATLGAVDSLDASVTLTALMASNTRRLDTVRVNAEYDRLSRRIRGFEERRKTVRGVFVDRAEIAMRRPQLLSDLLRGRGNITVQRNGTGDTQIFGPRLSIGTGYCALALILDGTYIPTDQGRIDAIVPIDMVAAIEVYTSGTSVPSQFARPETDCGAVVAWTR